MFFFTTEDSEVSSKKMTMLYKYYSTNWDHICHYKRVAKTNVYICCSSEFTLAIIIARVLLKKMRVRKTEFSPEVSSGFFRMVKQDVLDVG